MEYRIEDLTKEEAAYIGEKINEIVPREVDADEEEFVLKVENDTGEIVGGCVAEAYEYLGWMNAIGITGSARCSSVKWSGSQERRAAGS